MKTLELDERKETAALRALVSLALGYVLLFSPPIERSGSLTCMAGVALQLLSCAALLRVPKTLLEDARFLGSVLLADLALIAWVMSRTGNADTDFYLIFFLVILMSGMQRDVRLSFVVGGVAAVLYGTLWSRSHVADGLDAATTLRFPFFFITAFFSAAFTRRAESRQRALESSRERGSDADRRAALSALAGGMAAEFGAFVAATRADAKVLADAGAGDAARRVLARCESAAELVVDLADAGGLGRGEPVRLNLRHVLEDAPTSLGPVVGETVAIALEMPEDLPLVRADRRQLNRLLAALALDAREAAGGLGRVTLSAAAVDRADLPSALSPAHAARYVRLRFSHDGRALEPREAARVFEPAAGRGRAGLRLPAAYGIVRRAGGDMCLEEGPGRRYAIYLPAAAVAEPEASFSRPF